MSARERVTRRYAAVLLGITGAVLAGILAINLLVDPLWFVGGNRVGVNYAFNERISKTNLLLDAPEAYDCVVLGSSRTTLLDAGAIQGHRCFNYAVSQATDADLAAQLRYLKQIAPELALIVVGVDSYLLSKDDPGLANGVPHFMRTLQRPPDLFSTYLSLDALDFSWRTLRRTPPNFRYYDERFVVGVIEGAGPFEPGSEIVIGRPRKRTERFDQFPLGPFSKERAAIYDVVEELYPEAKTVGYVPPVTAHYSARLRFAGTLDSLLEATAAAAARFDAFHDFSVPSPLTEDADNTYDGGHFYPAANDRVAAVLSGAGEADLALPVHALSPQDYRSAYRARVQAYIERERLRPATETAGAR